MSKAWHKIEITPLDIKEESYVVEIETDDIEWTMNQYQRNRKPLNWKMLDWDIRV